jgi:Rrf2 family nitric oxide-sensitive transcriptional repressor
MQLTRYTDYALRVLIYLALLPDDKLASIDEISRTYDVSRNNVNKIVHQLGKDGVINTKRGKGGGLSLGKHPQDINIGDMVIKLENTLSVVECTKPLCCILPACKLKGMMQEATNAFITSLQRYSLADLLRDEKQSLINLLELDNA